MKRTKVLHIVGRMHPGGIETLLMNLYRQVDRDQYEFHFAVHTEEDAFYDWEIRTLGGTIVRLPHPKQGLRVYRRALTEAIESQGPYDAIHSHIFGFSGYIMKVARNLRIPVRISHSHNTQDGKRQNWLRTLYRGHMRRLIHHHATGMLGCSREACESLFGRSCWRDKRVQVFRNAIDPAPYADLDTRRRLLKERLGLPPDTLLIGHIGRFSPQKNHEFLLETFAALRSRRPAAHLVLIGDGPLREQIEEQSLELGLAGHVSFLGLRPDIPELLGALDLFLLPSLYEGLGIVLIEAQAAGVPCLASDRVPGEADLGIGLLKQLPLESGVREWAVQMNRISAQRTSPEWKDRHEALVRGGYDIGHSAQQLARMYHG